MLPNTRVQSKRPEVAVRGGTTNGAEYKLLPLGKPIVRVDVPKVSPVSGGSNEKWYLGRAGEITITTEVRRPLTIHDLGWTREKAAQVRAQLAAFAEDWDDPSMDVYDETQTW